MPANGFRSMDSQVYVGSLEILHSGIPAASRHARTECASILAREKGSLPFRPGFVSIRKSVGVALRVAGESVLVL